MFAHFRDYSSSFTDVAYKDGNMNRGKESATNKDDA